MGAERRTRGRMSRIDRLDPAVKAQLDKMLRGRVPQAEILERLSGHFSRSGLNRYATKMEAVGARIRETRSIAEAWIARLGDEPTGEVGQLAIEVLRTIAFDFVVRAAGGVDEEEEAPALDAEAIGDLALAIQRLERAADLGRAREGKMRAALAEQVEPAARAQGLSKRGARELRKALMENWHA